MKAITAYLLEAVEFRNNIFKIQDLNKGHFDVIFQFSDNKKLYAHKFILSTASEPFEAMFSKNWDKKNPIIKIVTSKYEDFKKLIYFIYTGECNLTNINVFDIVDLAESYEIVPLKILCDEFLSKMELNEGNILFRSHFSDTYSSLSNFKTKIISFLSNNVSMLSKSNKFLEIKKGIIEAFIVSDQYFDGDELLEIVYKWTETQVLNSGKLHESKGFYETVKNEMYEIGILSKMNLEKMSVKFLSNFFAQKDFLLSKKELDIILYKRQYGFLTVKAENESGMILIGNLSINQNHSIEFLNKIYDTISSLKNVKSDIKFLSYHYWETQIAIPKTPSNVKKSQNGKYHLVLTEQGQLAIKKISSVENDDFLLCHMKGNGCFTNEKRCEIEAFRKS